MTSRARVNVLRTIKSLSFGKEKDWYFKNPKYLFDTFCCPFYGIVARSNRIVSYFSHFYRLVSSTSFPNLGSACLLMVYRMSALWALIAKVDIAYSTCTTIWRPKRKCRKWRYFAFALKVYPICKICDACCCFRNPLTVWKSIQQPQIM